MSHFCATSALQWNANEQLPRQLCTNCSQSYWGCCVGYVADTTIPGQWNSVAMHRWHENYMERSAKLKVKVLGKLLANWSSLCEWSTQWERVHIIHSVMAHLQKLELCRSVEKTLREPCQIVIVEFPENDEEYELTMHTKWAEHLAHKWEREVMLAPCYIP